MTCLVDNTDPILKRRKDKENKETKLEIEVQKCSHMILNLENLKKPWINLGASDATKITIGAIRLKTEEDIICELTKKPCVLYFSYSPRINYSCLERCPSSEDSTKKYKLKGIKREHMFCVSKIDKLGE